MNSILTMHPRGSSHIARRNTYFTHTVCILTVSLVMASYGHAQFDESKLAQTRETQLSSSPLYSMKFKGGSIETLEQELKEAFPKDNVVIAPSAKHMKLNLSGFEIRDVRLKELGKTIEFLSDSKLIVEVTEMDAGAAGSIWRIGSRLGAMPPALLHLKMRSVAAPHLFMEQGKADRVKEDAMRLEADRMTRAYDSARVGASDILGAARLELLPEQRIFVIIGNDDGIAGMESFIKAAEQLAVDEAAKKSAMASSLAPTMRAVLAPHLFNNNERLNRITEEFNNVQAILKESHAELMEKVGVRNFRSDIFINRRPDQKLFVLIGSEEDIAGMESLIQAAEKNAAEQDAREQELFMAAKAELDAARRRETEAAEKAK